MMPAPAPFHADSRGFTLVEVLVAIVVFALGILALNRLQMSSITTNAYSFQLAQATNLAHARMDQLMNLAYNHNLLSDTNGNGRNQDSNSNGIDDDDEGISGGDDIASFGLDDNPFNPDAERTVPDHTDPVVTPLASYDVGWNVAFDVPVAGVKTIRTYVTWTDRKNVRHSISFDCTKGQGY